MHDWALEPHDRRAAGRGAVISVPHIDWQPIANVPDSRKDGRRMLLWADDIGNAEVAEWEGGIWVTPGGATVRGATYWADINPPH